MRRLLWAVAMAAAAGCALPLAAQISPGPLAEPHAALDGSRNCLECHSRGEGVDPAKCLACHALLRERIDAGEGLHAAPGYRDCRTCHVDHHGREFELVFWGEAGMASFDHRLAGWPLEGAHAEVDCRGCHAAENIAQPRRLIAAGKSLDRTFLGLETECAACHADPHRGQFEGRECVACHELDAFDPASLFDHDTAAFELTGSHRDVACADCHREETDDGVAVTRFRPVAHAACTDCHRDPHRGELGGDCASCHATESWWTTPGFDHARTRFPLTGRHRGVACGDCHRQGSAMVFRGLPFAACSDCHADPHEARLGADCASCHSTAGWRGTTASAGFDHTLTRFALEGAHAEVDCAACHRPGQPLRIADFERCASCHADEHLGQFAGREDGGECAACHTVEAFVPATFTVDDHQRGRFPLEGEHLAVDCVECHRETTFRARDSGAVVATRKFAWSELGCESCHADPHGGTVDAWWAASGSEGDRCQSCHAVDGWSAIRFDHRVTGFALEGAHREAPCIGCHQAAPTEGVTRPLRLGGLDADCASCHDEPHGGQFVGRAGGCASCHTTTAWSLLDFNHDATDFPLSGAHARAACDRCHRPSTDGAVVQFADLPTRCEACHGG